MMQVGKSLDERLYHNSLHCIRLVLAREGVRGFYLGLAPNLVRSVGAAPMLVAYDSMKEWI
jgi:solute carrier family 25 (adenine nucleotide translocator) protein 4/5/6/31